MKFFHFIAAFIVLTITFNTWDICFKSCHSNNSIPIKSHCSHQMAQEQAAAKLQPKPCCNHQIIFNQDLKNSISNEATKITGPVLASLQFVYPTLSGLQKSLFENLSIYSTPASYFKQHTVMRV